MYIHVVENANQWKCTTHGEVGSTFYEHYKRFLNICRKLNEMFSIEQCLLSYINFNEKGNVVMIINLSLKFYSGYLHFYLKIRFDDLQKIMIAMNLQTHCQYFSW